jgi:hypothetical protein
MTPLNETRLRRIRRMSKVIRVVCSYFLATIVLGTAAVVIALVVGRGGQVGLFGIWFKVSDLTPFGRILVGAMGVFTFGIMFKCFYHLHGLMTNYSRAEIFTMKSSSHIRQIGICCALIGSMEMLWPFVPRLVLARSTIPVITHGPDLILCGLIVIAISWFMSIAAEMQEENELTV